jgi:hypothetical protein
MEQRAVADRAGQVRRKAAAIGEHIIDALNAAVIVEATS